MSYCLNPSCWKRENPDNVKCCQGCGSKLLLKDRYRPIRSIGQGGFGRTFLAVDEDMLSKPYCVIKQFFYQGKDFEKAEELFRQEAVQLDVLGKEHPQIPELMEHLELDSGLYLVEEFIEGKDLLEELKEQGAFEETKIKQLLNDLLPVLQFIHKNRVIHRDIKPENIIRRQIDDKLVLVDFGVSKLATETALGRTGTVIGTKGYAAPEQSQGKVYFSSDLYSLGRTCFHLLTEEHPSNVFIEYGDWQKYLRIGLQKSGIGDELKLILTKLLHTDIKERYQSAEEVLQDLDIKQIQATTESLLIIPTSPSEPLTESWKCVHTLSKHSWEVRTVAISPDGKILASGATDHQIMIWDLQTGNRLNPSESLLGDVDSIAFSPDGETFVSAGWASKSKRNKEIFLWDLRTMKKLRHFCGNCGHFGSVSSVAISPDGKILATGGGDKTIKLWNLQTGEILNTLPGHTSFVDSVAISPNGRILATSSRDRTIKLWNLPTGEFIKEFSDDKNSTNWGFYIAISPDGQTLATHNKDSSIKLWDLQTGEPLNRTFLPSHSQSSIAFSADSQNLATGGEDNTVKIWEVSTGQLLHTLTGHSNMVFAVAFSPDGKIIASGGADSTIKIWCLSS